MKTNNEFCFNPAKEEGLKEKSRLVIYDNVKKEFFHMEVIEAEEEFKMPYDAFEPHFDYKYKYQTLDTSSTKPIWKDTKDRYTRVLPEVVDDSGLKYLYFAPKVPSDKMVVHFQALQRVLKYAYVQPLNDVNVHRIYIKEGYGREPATKASLYLNENNVIPVEEAVQELVARYAKLLGISKHNTIFSGASQGGYAAIFQGYRYGAGHIIAGEPAYYLGNYEDISNFTNVPVELYATMIEYITGRLDSTELREYSNNVLINRIKSTTPPYPNTKILVGSSPVYNQTQLEPFKLWLNQNNIPNVEFYNAGFKTHQELVEVFVPFLKETINKIINH